jgi:hypothetical protein
VRIGPCRPGEREKWREVKYRGENTEIAMKMADVAKMWGDGEIWSTSERSAAIFAMCNKVGI